MEIKTHVSNNIITTLTPELLKYCKDHLEIDNPDYTKKLRMGLWIRGTPKKISLYHIRDKNIILPFGCIRNIFHLIKDSKLTYQFADSPISICGQVPLYDYQEEAVGMALNYKNGVLVSAAGSGKTQIGIEIIRRIGKKTLWLTHTLDLLQQSKKRAEQYLRCNIGTIESGKSNIQDVTFATVQTLCRMNLGELKNEFGLLIVDECHRVAGSPTSLTMFSKVINSLACRYKIGLTATPHRADGMIKSLYALLGDVFHTVSSEKTAEKTLRAKVELINTGYNLTGSSEALDTDGTIIFAKLINELCEDPGRNNLIANLILQNKNEGCLVLSDRINHLKELRKIVGYGVIVDGKTNKADREYAIEAMRTGREKLLFASYKLAKEGLDIPCLNRLFLAAPQKDQAVIVQSVGRIERAMEGKTQGIVYDFVDEAGICKSHSRARNKIYKGLGCEIDKTGGVQCTS